MTKLLVATLFATAGAGAGSAAAVDTSTNETIVDGELSGRADESEPTPSDAHTQAIDISDCGFDDGICSFTICNDRSGECWDDKIEADDYCDCISWCGQKCG